MGEMIMNIGMDYLPLERARKLKEKKKEFVDRVLVLCGLIIVMLQLSLHYMK